VRGAGCWGAGEGLQLERSGLLLLQLHACLLHAGRGIKLARGTRVISPTLARGLLPVPVDRGSQLIKARRGGTAAGVAGAVGAAGGA
jgi:hypothetical protein